MTRTPLLIVSDSPNGSTGLGMVTGEIAKRANESLSDVFDIAVAGYGDDNSGRQPFKVYPFIQRGDYVIPELPRIWRRFAGDREGIIMSIGNISWLGRFAYPELIQDGQYHEFRDFVMSGRFKHWAYVPIDSENLNGKLSNDETLILKRIDRILAYTKYGADVIDRTLTQPEGTTQYLPHGTDAKMFYPRDKKAARESLLGRIGCGVSAVISDDVIIVGIFATNTARKDWPLALKVCGILVERGYNIGVLLHTDRMKGEWNIKELCHLCGLEGRVFESTKPLPKEDVAWLYAACDVVLANGRGEGWGLPITESLAMGVPVVHGNYAGGPENMPKEWTVEPIGYQVETFWGNKRPVFKAEDWAAKVEEIWLPGNEPRKSFLKPELYWDQAWPAWEKWFRKGMEVSNLPSVRDIELVSRMPNVLL